MVQMKNRVSGLLMETGVDYNKQRLHKVSYFRELLFNFRHWAQRQREVGTNRRDKHSPQL
jgi:hypothetical protein